MDTNINREKELLKTFTRIENAIVRTLRGRYYSFSSYDADRIAGSATGQALAYFSDKGVDPLVEKVQWEKLARCRANQLGCDLLRHRISVGKIAEESFLEEAAEDESGEEREMASALIDAAVLGYGADLDLESEKELTRVLRERALRIIKNTIGLTLEAQVFISRIIREESVERVAKRFRIPEQKVSDYTFKVKKLLIRYNKFNLAA